MKVWTHSYQIGEEKKRRGCLLKVEWAMASTGAAQVGYSDLHPWPQYGDQELDFHLEQLRRLELTPLVDRSLHYNSMDRDFRVLGRSAFVGLGLPKTHSLILDVIKLQEADLLRLHQQGFTHLKLKMDMSFAEQTKHWLGLSSVEKFFWRLDFNGRLDEAAFTDWWRSLPSKILHKIDFVEDPLATGFPSFTGPWAADWLKDSRMAIQIVKPMRERVPDALSGRRLIFTHSLDHPLGRAVALWESAKYFTDHPKRMEVCGLGSGKPTGFTAFDQLWLVEGPRMKPPPGNGFGFDEVLRELPWVPLF